MPNQMSGLFDYTLSQDAPGTKLARFQQELKDYQHRKDIAEQQSAIEALSPYYQDAMRRMSPERQAQMRLQMEQQKHFPTFDEGARGAGQNLQQRGQILKTQSEEDIKYARWQKQNAEKLKTEDDTKRAYFDYSEAEKLRLAKEKKEHAAKLDQNYKLAAQTHDENEKIRAYKEKRDYLLANLNPLDQTADKQNYDHWIALGNPDDPSEITRAQINWYNLKRKEQMVDLETGFQSVSDKDKFLRKNIEEKVWRESVGGDNAEAYINFPEMLNSTESFIEGMERKRESIQMLHASTNDKTTGAESFFSIIPATRAKAWLELKDEIVANIGLDKLMEMKKAGGAQGASGLGALSDTEMAILTKSMGSLEQANTPETIRRVLRRLDKEYARILNNHSTNIKRLHRKNRNSEQQSYFPSSQFKYEVHPDQEYLLGVEGAVKKEGYTPLLEEALDTESMSDDFLINELGLTPGVPE